MSDNAIFAEVKRAASMVEYIEAAVGGQVVKSGASTFVNPAPCCGHNDCFSVFSPNKDGAQDAYRCHSCGAKGDVFSVATELQGLEMKEALRAVAAFAGVSLPAREKAPGAAPREASRAEYIAEQCLKAPAAAVEYLVGKRGISHEVASRAVLKRAVGFNDYRSPSREEGAVGHGGPALATIVRSLNPGHVMAVDLRYLDPALNGGVKTQTQGEKQGYGWTSDIKRLHGAETVYFCESAVNALSIETAGMPGRTAAFAIRGTGNAGNIDLAWCRGKQVVIVADNDAPGEDGYCAGLRSAWTLHERLLGLDVPALLVDMSEWGEPEEINDVNDLLRSEGAAAVQSALRRLEPWLIPGMAQKGRGRPRVFLPAHHWAVYDSFRVKPDFTSHFMVKTQKDEDGNETPAPPVIRDLAGFRVASISRVTVQSATATLTGVQDSAPSTMYAVSVQKTGATTLVRKTLDEDKLFNIETWKKFGFVADPNRFLRLVNVLENAVHVGSRKAANFVGLCWLDGRLAVSEGRDCYFEDPHYQCLHHNLVFPSGPRANGQKVLEAYRDTFTDRAGLLTLVWALGAHLKAVIGYWPHMQAEADKGAGKSTFIERLGMATGMRTLSSQTLATAYRMINSVAFTSQPVCWEEFARLSNQNRKQAMDLLQETYKHMESTRSKLPFVFSAPVLVAGEDAPVEDIIGKLVRVRLSAKHHGPEIPLGLPQFPVRQWLDWLAAVNPDQIRKLLEACKERLQRQCRSTDKDNNVKRMVGNYAAVATAWMLLAEFCGVEPTFGAFSGALVTEMNEHISDTSGDRQPWVWVMETLGAELARKTYFGPWKIEHHLRRDPTTGLGEEAECLFVRTSDVMHHMATTPALRDFWNELPIKSDRVLKRQLVASGVVFDEAEKTINGRRVPRMVALDLKALAAFGVEIARPDEGY